MNRRQFFAAGAAAVSAASAQETGAGRPSLLIFSKHMAQYNYDELGKEAKKAGFDGVDLTVRAKGHVLPERAAQDMPKAVEIIKSHGLTVPMITTNILQPDEPTTRPILSTAGRLKVRYVKPGYWLYRSPDVEGRLAEFVKATRGIVEVAREYGVETGIHNHSGNYLGTAVWDIREALRGVDPKWAGYYLDPGHATAEGGAYNWVLSTQLALPRLKMIAVKDFYWEKQGGKWRMKWCPLGEGMVDWPRFFSMLAAAKWTGPITLHVEYEPADEPAAIVKDLQFLKAQVGKAYGA